MKQLHLQIASSVAIVTFVGRWYACKVCKPAKASNPCTDHTPTPAWQLLPVTGGTSPWVTADSQLRRQSNMKESGVARRRVPACCIVSRCPTDEVPCQRTGAASAGRKSGWIDSWVKMEEFLVRNDQLAVYGVAYSRSTFSRRRFNSTMKSYQPYFSSLSVTKQ